MRRKWTRKLILQEILRRESRGLPLSLGGECGLDTALYQAATRIFGSWRNAIIAAGITPQRAIRAERWQPVTVLNAIRRLAKQKRPLTLAEVEKRHGSMVSAARRFYGSWPKAVIAAGVDPGKFRCVVAWSRERIIEGILIRALNNEPLGPRTAPRSLVDAGKRVFGTWAAAKAAAGVSSAIEEGRAIGGEEDLRLGAEVEAAGPHKQRTPWTSSQICTSIVARLHQGRRMNATAVYDENNELYHAAIRRYGSWSNALSAAGLKDESCDGSLRSDPISSQSGNARVAAKHDGETDRPDVTP